MRPYPSKKDDQGEPDGCFQMFLLIDPAMGSMMMNIAANMLGLSNAATPLGLRAMEDLEKPLSFRAA
jgi:hypothetical protein